MKNWSDIAPRDSFLQLGGGLSIHVAPAIGDLHITVYRFEAGARLPAHAHMRADRNHISIVALGAVTARWSDGEARVFPAGSVIDLEEGVTHEFQECLGASAVVVNIRRLGGTTDDEYETPEALAKIIAAATLKEEIPIRQLTREELEARGFVHANVNRGV
jgi:quercetin dioxygenase-like cupin family protein